MRAKVNQDRLEIGDRTLRKGVEIDAPESTVKSLALPSEQRTNAVLLPMEPFNTELDNPSLDGLTKQELLDIASTEGVHDRLKNCLKDTIKDGLKTLYAGHNN